MKFVCSRFSVLLFPQFVICFDSHMFQFRFIYANLVPFYEIQTSVCISEILVSRKALAKISGVTESKQILKET